MLSKTENKSSSGGSAGLIQLFRALRLALGERFRRVFLVAALGLISGLLEVLILYLIALIGTAVVRQSSTVTVSLPLLEAVVVDVPDIIRLALLILAMLLALVYPLSRSAATLNRIALNRTRKRLTDAYMNSEWALRSRDPEGHMQILVGEYCTASESLVQHVSTIVISLGTLTMIAIATVLSAPIAAGVALLGTVVIASLVRPMNRRIKKRAADVATVNKVLASNVAEVSRVAPEIAAFSVGEKVLAKIKDQIEAIGLTTARLRLMTRMAPLVYQYGALILVVLIVAVMFNISPSALAGAGPVILMMVRALGYSKQLQTAIQAGSALLPYPEYVEKEIERLQRHKVVDRTAVIGEFEQIQLRDVSFAYLEESVLQDVNLTIQAGEAVGVVGPSGGGKSTLVQLLLRLQTPTSGSIEINGTDPRSIDDHCWASLIAYVPQENKLIHGSVVDNIRFFREGYELDSVIRAARAAHLHDEIERLPDGYDTVIGAGASDLSGGQRQRLGIARAMLAEPEILVLDEPTSALDQRSEELLKTTLEELRGRQTLILVAHRPSTLKVCQRILIVDRGSISSASPDAVSRFWETYAPAGHS